MTLDEIRRMTMEEFIERAEYERYLAYVRRGDAANPNPETSAHPSTIHEYTIGPLTFDLDTFGEGSIMDVDLSTIREYGEPGYSGNKEPGGRLARLGRRLRALWRRVW